MIATNVSRHTAAVPIGRIGRIFTGKISSATFVELWAAVPLVVVDLPAYRWACWVLRIAGGCGAYSPPPRRGSHLLVVFAGDWTVTLVSVAIVPAEGCAEGGVEEDGGLEAVSYTHLTLPTIYAV